MSWKKHTPVAGVLGILAYFAKSLKRGYKTLSRRTRAAHKSLLKRVRSTKFYHRASQLLKQYSWSKRPLVAAGCLVMVLVLVSGILSEPVRASQTWEQNDWTGGVGSSTSNQYASATNIDGSTAGQLSLSKESNLFTNPGFTNNVTSWNGVGNSYETTIKRTGVGSAYVAAAASSASPVIAQSDTSLPATTSGPQQMDSADFNGDGLDDIVVAGDTAQALYVYLSNGKGGWQSPTTHTGVAQSLMDVVAADFDGDGDMDIAATYGNTASFSVFLNNGSGASFTRTEYSGPTTRACALDVGRFNNDSLPDIVMTCYVWNSYTVFLNNGSGGFPTKVSYDQGTSNVGGTNDLVAVDINGDGFDDVASQISGCNIRYILNNGGSGFASYADYTISGCSGNWGTAYALNEADMNGDQYEDLVFSLYTGSTGTPVNTSYISTVLGQSSGVPTGQANYAAIASFASGVDDVESADLNGDGHADVIAFNRSSNQSSIYLNNGDGTLATKVDGTTGTYPIDGSTGDYNGDGKADFTILNRGSGNVGLRINRHDGTVLSQLINVGDTGFYILEGYVYTNGSAVTSSDAVLYANGQSLSTSYVDAGSGWYKLSAVATGTNAKRGYGVSAKPSKTIYVDDMALFKYQTPGVLTSSIFDLGFGGDWGTLSYSTAGSGTVSVKVRTGNNSDMSDAPAFSSCSAIANGSDLTGQSCMTNNHRYVQYEVTLTAADGQTPTVQNVIIEYSPWDTVPPDTNASTILMWKSNGGASINENDWTNATTPYFSWGSASDNAGGTGIKGYCIYLGQDQGSDPVSTKGVLGTSPVDTDGACQFAVADANVDLSTSGYIQTALSTSNTPYYFAVKAIDNANNVYTGSAEEFYFRFDNTKPTNPSFVTAPSQFVASKEVSLTWPTTGGEAASDANSGIVGLQYRIGNSSSWYGDAHSGTQDITDLLTNDGEYTTVNSPDFPNINEGNNIIYFRTWDQAGNVSTVYITTVLRLNTSSPSSPQTVTATPSTNTTNSFAFSWDPPASYTGSAGNLTYCYTVNTLPTVNTCTYTAAGVTSLAAAAFATQPGENTFYVVARDEASNINYATAASTTFTANTSAPGIPLNMGIVDISVKATSNWRLALSWDPPQNTGAGIANYRIYRSTDNMNFTNIAATSGTSFVDGGLAQTEYYYRIAACDSANNCGAYSTVVNELPTGKYTTPALSTSSPRVSSISTRKATIRWSTDRTSDSKIQYGTSSGNYFSTEAAISAQVTDHEVLLNNLAAGTTYYFKAKWTDEDGNTGSSAEYSFRTAAAPVVKEVTSEPSLTSANLSFTSKDAAQVKIYYGKSDSFGGTKTLNTSLVESQYTTELTDLDDGSKYFFKLNTYDSDGNEYEGNIYSFTTPPRPRISNLRFQPVKDQPSSTQRITWDTNVSANSELSYGVDQPSKSIVNAKLTTRHELVVSGLEDNKTYVLVARSRDANGNATTSDQQVFKTDLDTRPPKITDVQVDSSIRGTGAEARGQVVLSWKTDEPSTSQVAYGEGSSGFLSSSTSEDGKLTTEHVVVISDLSTSKVYHFEPRSFDQARNEAAGEQKVAIIGRGSENVLSIIFDALQNIFGISQDG